MTTERFLSEGRALPRDNNLEDRCIRYVFSDPSVGRDMHTIAANAWDTRNFQNNPVFLWAHQDDELPIGRVENLSNDGNKLVGTVRYADHPMADTVYKMVKDGFLNATSTGWIPLEWASSQDRSRPGGKDFTRVELLEISQVPVPALPTALVSARAAGIDTTPVLDWAKRLLTQNNFAILPRSELETIQKRTMIMTKPIKRDFSLLVRTAIQRGYNHVSELAMHLRAMEDLHDRMCQERETEGDGSTIPDEMRGWLNDGHDLLQRAMAEESQEYQVGTQAPEPSPYSLASLERAIENVLTRKEKTPKVDAEFVRCVRNVHSHIENAHKTLSRALVNIYDDDIEHEEDSERTLQKQKVKLLALKSKQI